MKRKSYLIFFIVLFTGLTSIFSGCTSKNKPTMLYATKANFASNYLEAYVGDVITLNENEFQVEPKNLQTNFMFSSSNSNIASVNALTGTISCLKVGTVIISCKVKKDEKTFIGDSYTLTIKTAPIYATNFSFQTEENIVMALNSEAFNKITYSSENVSIVPTVSYSESGIVSYDCESGKITSYKLGEVTVYVNLKLKDGSTLTKHFLVQVIDNNVFIEANDTYYVQKNQVFEIKYLIKDNINKTTGLYSNQNVEAKLIIGTSTILEVDYLRILIKAGSDTGSSVIELTSIQDASIKKLIVVHIS